MGLSAGASNPEPADAPPDAGKSRATIGWEQLESTEYREYLDRLRAAGCPEERIRMIVKADADEWLLQQRIAHAVANDFAWWKAEPPSAAAGLAFTDRYRELRERRAELVRSLVGEDAEQPEEDEVPIVVNLSGPVLGALPPEKYNAVQEICAGSMDRHQGYFNSRQSQGVFLNQGDMAEMREATRASLSAVLTEEELEEFLLRYSHNANRLRMELSGLEPTPEEFRKVFRAVDKLEHQLQLEYGAIDSLSSRQREEFARQREEAIREVLSPERYQRYLMARYPLFRQALRAVRGAGLPDDVVVPFYEVLNRHESRRREVLNNTALSVAERQNGLRALEQEKERALEQALGAEGYRQYRESLVN